MLWTEFAARRPVKALLCSVALAALLCLAPTTRAQVGPVEDFKQTLSNATVAIYEGKQDCDWKPTETLFGLDYDWVCKFKTSFVCTGTVVRAKGDDMYLGLTAGHCFDPDTDYYVSDEISDKPVVHKITLLKYDNSDRYDFGVFRFSSMKKYPTVEINGDEDGIPANGTIVENVNFSLGLGRITLSGEVVSGSLALEGMPGRFLTTLGIGPGASGSPIVDASTHKIVGLVEAQFRGTQIGAVAIPTGKLFWSFLDDDSAGLKPLPPAGTPPQPPAPLTAKQHVAAIWQLFVDWVKSLF